MRAKSAYLFVYSLAWLILLPASLYAENDDGLGRKIQLPKAAGTIYELLEKVTNRSGYFFIYDNQTISNEQSARIRKGEYTIRQAIYEITGNPQLQLRLIGKHILIQLPAEQSASISYNTAQDSLFFTVEGTLLDAYSREPAPYATIGLPTDAIGTVSNQNGDFRLRLPDSLRRSVVRISHLGYETKELPVSTLLESSQVIILEPKVISIQEVVVRLVNPMRLLHNMLDKREQNYSTKPVYFTSFYREGVERKKGFVNLTEAVFKIYKTPYNSFPEAGDQVKLLKMRRISNEDERDTLITKMKSGINASLMLDVIKNLPDFLLAEEEAQYNFLHSDITVIDDRLTNVVSFEQKKDIKEPFYKGELYIDAENDALLSTRFEINPKYVEKATDMLVTHKSKNLRITTQQVVYTVSYKPWNGKYYVSHIRGDLYFKVRKANQLIGSTSLHTWFEMVTCKIETQDVTRFTRNETLQTRTIFAETSFAYDNLFWENFNIILPEEQLNDAINKITSKIEETGGLP